jgi:hypothetical protein
MSMSDITRGFLRGQKLNEKSEEETLKEKIS